MKDTRLEWKERGVNKTALFTILNIEFMKYWSLKEKTIKVYLEDTSFISQLSHQFTLNFLGRCLFFPTAMLLLLIFQYTDNWPIKNITKVSVKIPKAEYIEVMRPRKTRKTNVRESSLDATMDGTFLWCLAIRSAFFHFKTEVCVRRRHRKPVELGGQQKKICWRGNISTDSRDGYCYHTFKMAINFVANFPIDKINLNLFFIISKTSKSYNGCFSPN